MIMAGAKKLRVRTDGFTSRFVHGVKGVPDITAEGVELTKAEFQQVLNVAEPLKVTLVADETDDDSGSESGPEGS